MISFVTDLSKYRGSDVADSKHQQTVEGMVLQETTEYVILLLLIL